MSKNKTNKKEKNFDAVKTMREIRDQLSKEIMHMTFAEEKAYLKKLLSQKSVNWYSHTILEGMTLSEKKAFMQQVREGRIKMA